MKKLQSVVLTAVFALVSGTAHAATITESFTATLSGTDTLGLFGTAGASLTGQTAAFSLAYDPATATGHYAANVSSDDYFTFVADSSIIQDVTVAGHDLNFTAAAAYSHVDLGGSPSNSSFSATTRGAGGTIIQVNLSSTTGWATGMLLSQASMDAIYAGLSSTGYFIVGTDSASESISFSEVQASSSAAPEPSTWLLMASFLGSAAILRTRKPR